MIGGSRSFVIYIVAMTGGYVFAGFVENAPYSMYAVQVTLGAIAYWTKRLVQKRKEYGKD